MQATRPVSASSPERTVLPPTPPPEFDLDVWHRTIDEIERRRPERLALVHFGVADGSRPRIWRSCAGVWSSGCAWCNQA